MNLEVTLAVQRELESRAAEIDTMRRQHVERTDRRAQEQAAALDDEARRRIRELAEQFPRVWNALIRPSCAALP
jgi:hypothetical protein